MSCTCSLSNFNLLYLLLGIDIHTVSWYMDLSFVYVAVCISPDLIFYPVS